MNLKWSVALYYRLTVATTGDRRLDLGTFYRAFSYWSDSEVKSE
jgi:hypothetical protein